MRIAKTSASTWWVLGTLLLLVASFLAAPTPAMAQCNTHSALQGFNAVYGNCGTTNQGTLAMVDASQYSSSGNGDICAAIQAIFIAYSHTPQSRQINQGVVVDARAFKAGQTQNCSDNPWDSTIVNPEPPSSVVLLPAGTITIFNTLDPPHQRAR